MYSYFIQIEFVKQENQTMKNILRTTEKDLQHKTELKLKLENEILSNLQECLLNDKAVEAMANGIKKMREMSRKQVSEIPKNRYSFCLGSSGI